MNRSQLKNLVTRASEIQQILEQVKPLYAELDAITMELAMHSEGKPFTSAGRQVIIEDNFESKNSSWKSVAIRRFVLKIK